VRVRVAGLIRQAVDAARFQASIGELNPTRSAGDPDAIPRFADSIARIRTVTGRG
jgi:hypothetical protein